METFRIQLLYKVQVVNVVVSSKLYWARLFHERVCHTMGIQTWNIGFFLYLEH